MRSRKSVSGEHLFPAAGFRRLWAILLVTVIALAGYAAAAPPPAGQAADVIVLNARIYTVNPRQPWAEALAIAKGEILAVGSAREITRYRARSTRVIDARQHLVLPGFVDCHIHFLDGSFSLQRVNLEGAKTVAEINEQVKSYAAAHPHEPWILGRGWSYPVFGAAALPDKKYLDEVVPDRPVFLEGFDGHTYWANSKALALAGINRDTPDPPNGAIVRDPQTGEPTGALKEAASELVVRVIPKPTRAQTLEALRRGLAEASRAGLVRIHSAGGDFDSLELFDELRRKGELTVRISMAYFLDPPELTPAAVERIEWMRKTYHDDWIGGGAVKIMLDGVVESHTAAMFAPYSDDPSQSGKLFWDPDKYRQAVVELDRRGLQVYTHAIGDRAVGLALDAYEQAEKTNGSKDPRYRVEHIETIAAGDIPRFGRLGVIASFQPLHAYPDDDTLKVWARNAGPDRASRGWSWHSIATGGGRLAFGSDWPVVTLNPWQGLQNAVTRQTWEGTPPGGWLPEQRVSLVQAIEAYALGAAVAGRREKREGSLESGKLADLIFVSQDLFKIDPHQIRHTEALLTMVGGKVVYESPGWRALSGSQGQQKP